MRYCQTCILPDTRPGINVTENNGECKACSLSRSDIRPSKEVRLKEFENLVFNAKAMGSDWDCVIPVSGGKDSTWQTLKALEYGLKPLCVTWRTPSRTDIGQANLHNLINLGVDHLDVTVSPSVEKEFTKNAFERVGIPALPMHMALHSIPTNIALQFKIPLLIQGENSAFEYGGSDKDAGSSRITRGWLKRYGVSAGTFIEDWVSKKLSARDLKLYAYPSDETLEKSNLQSVFLGYFLNWSPHEAYRVAREHGFRALDKPIVGNYGFADIDEAFIMTVHHWLKWYKFGVTRDWDNLSIDIRQGKMTRAKAFEIIRKKGSQPPIKEIELFCEYIDITLERFWEISESFRDKNIWKKDPTDGLYKIPGFAIKNFSWC